MPSPKKPCPTCSRSMHPTASQCRKCKPSYQRTPEHRRLMSARTQGKPKAYPTGGSDPAVAAKIAAAWTPQMREAARLRGERLALDPEWRTRCGSPGEANPMWENGRAQIPYARGWARKVKALAWERAGHRCEICQSDRPRDTHHRDFRKDNHSLENLQVLCRKCHKGLHASRAAQNRKNRRPHDRRQSTSRRG
jgi:hypothetical protein